MSETSPRAEAWATRRAKYGEAGHSGYRLRRSPIERRALRLITRLHAEEILSEGQCCTALDMDRTEFRALCDEFRRVGATLGEKIEIARKEAGLTQQDLAERVGLTRPQVANIEGGRSDVPTRRLIEIAAALGVSAGSLLP